MKPLLYSLLCSVLFIACSMEVKHDSPSFPLQGTWRLLTGTLIEKNDTVVTDYTKNTSFIKIINDSHFAFFQHDLNKGKDSSHVFSAGAGKYSLKDSTYIEHLEYCSAREWENNDFTFTVEIHNDTLTQRGVEKVDSLGINRLNVEKYVRLKQ